MFTSEVVQETVSEEYQKLCKNYGEDAVNTFIKIWSEEDLHGFEESFYGRYDSKEDFTEDFVSNILGVDIPEMIVIDWEATWKCNLRHDFYYQDGCVFCKNW
jgi:antirestriction protein